MTRSDETYADVRAELRAFYFKNGYVRWPVSERLEQEDAESYKKGAEVRLVAESPGELDRLRKLLRKVGFRLGKPWSKGRQFRQPIYGYEQVGRFLALVGE